MAEAQSKLADRERKLREREEAKFWRKHRLMRFYGTVKIGGIKYHPGEAGAVPNSRAASLIVRRLAMFV